MIYQIYPRSFADGNGDGVGDLAGLAEHLDYVAALGVDAVERAMHDVARFWLDRGVDGFRIDVANFVMKDPQLRDNPPAPERPSAYRPLGAYDTQLHLHDKNHPDTHAVYRRLRRLLDSYPGDRIAIGEIHVFDWPDWRAELARYHGEQLDELHLPMDQSLIGLPGSAAEYAHTLADLYRHLPAGAWPCLMLGSHDETRVAARIGPDRARAAMVVLLTLPAAPSLYFGDELGMTGAKIPPHRALDRWAAQTPDGALGRDPQRSPMQWTAGDNAGFCPPDVHPWLPVGDDADTANVADQHTDPNSTLNLTRRLLRLRSKSTALSRGELVLRSDGPDEVLAYERRHAGDRLLVAVNFASEPADVRLDESVNILLTTSSTHIPAGGPARRGLTLAAYEAVIARLATRRHPRRPRRTTRRCRPGERGRAWTRHNPATWPIRTRPAGPTPTGERTGTPPRRARYSGSTTESGTPASAARMIQASQGD